MTLTITDVQTGSSLPGSAGLETVTGRHRGRRADEDRYMSDRDFAGHGRHRRTARPAGMSPAEGPAETSDDPRRSPAQDEGESLGWERRVTDDLAALKA